MRMIDQSFEILEPQSHDLNGMYKQIELAGRTCYKSEDKITDDSAEPFVKRMINSGHGAMLEHGTVYLYVNNWMDEHNGKNANWDEYIEIRKKYSANKYSHCVEKDSASLYITTNYRVIVENRWDNDLKYMCEPTEHHVKRISVKFVCNRQISHEFVRHRAFSFGQESTRFCNYSKGKHGGELTFIKPCWYDSPETNAWSREILMNRLSIAEKGYLALIAEGWKPQQAATVLPNALKTELVMTGFVDNDGWINFFSLRAVGTTGTPHPQASELAVPLMEEFRKRGYIK